MRLNGSVRGKVNNPTVSAAVGCWGAENVFLARADSKWPSAVGDQYFANVVALMHFEGSDASTTLTDVTGKSWTAAADAQIDTAQYKFGSSSILFDGTGDYAYCSSSSDFDFGTGDFTIEFWMRSSQSSGSYTGMISVGSGSATGNWMIQNRTTTADCAFWWYDISGWKSVSTNTNVNDGNWHHIAVTRSGDSVRIFQDGTLKNTTTGASAHSIGNGSAGLNIGRDQYDNGYYNGWLDDLRVTKGVARYTASFTAPTAPFPDS